MKSKDCFGVFSPRWTTPLLPHTEQYIDGPLNHGIARWSMKDGRRVFFQSLHSSVISALQPCPVIDNLYLTTSYDGEVALWKIFDPQFSNNFDTSVKKEDGSFFATYESMVNQNPTSSLWKLISQMFNLDQCGHQGAKIDYATWSYDGKFILLVTEAIHCLIVLRVDRHSNSHKMAQDGDNELFSTYLLEYVTSLNSDFSFAATILTSNIHVCADNVKNMEGESGYKNQQGAKIKYKIFAVETIKTFCKKKLVSSSCNMHTIEFNGHQLKAVQKKPLHNISFPSTVFLNNNNPDSHNNLIVIKFENSEIAIVDISSLTILEWISNPLGTSSGIVRFTIFEKGETLLFGTSGRIAAWKLDLSKSEKRATYIGDYTYPCGSIYFMMLCSQSPKILDIQSRKNTDDTQNKNSSGNKLRKIWISNIEKLFLFNFDGGGINLTHFQSVGAHTLSCCGITHSHCNRFIACGDLQGNAYLYSIDSIDLSTLMTNNVGSMDKNHKNSVPLATISIGQSVRCITMKNNSKFNDIHAKRDFTQIKDYLIYVGTLGGEVYEWIVTIKIKTSSHANKEKCNAISYQVIGSELHFLFAVQGSINCLEWQNGANPKYLALGSQHGVLAVYERKRGGEKFMRLRWAIVAHKPIKSSTDQRFGSISKFSEIWSLSWSPCNKYIATASEDQTIIIWSLNADKVHVFPGHIFAVTSIDWRLVFMSGKIREILVTCSDDCKVIVWMINNDKEKRNEKYFQVLSKALPSSESSPHEDSEEDIDETDIASKSRWGLYHIFDTSDLDKKWHTLTYLSIEKQFLTPKLLNPTITNQKTPYKTLDNRSLGNPRIACSTQHGNLIIWDLEKKKLVKKIKIHHGSIEGMHFLPVLSEQQDFSTIITCSADCTINTYSLPHHI